MNREIFVYALLGGLAIALVFSIYSDLRYRKIYNKVTMTIALAAPFFWFANGEFTPADIGIHLLTAFLAFGFCALWFRIGWMGGGDVKLYCALSLWFGWIQVINLFLYSAIIGAILTLVFYAVHKLQGQKGPSLTPYGVAIALAALWIGGEPYFNHFA